MAAKMSENDIKVLKNCLGEDYPEQLKKYKISEKFAFETLMKIQDIQVYNYFTVPITTEYIEEQRDKAFAPHKIDEYVVATLFHENQQKKSEAKTKKALEAAAATSGLFGTPEQTVAEKKLTDKELEKLNIAAKRTLKKIESSTKPFGIKPKRRKSRSEIYLESLEQEEQKTESSKPKSATLDADHDKPHSVPHDEKHDKTESSMPITTDNNDTPKRGTAMFSCRMDADMIAKWKAYTKVEGYGNIGEMTAQALDEFMKNHELDNDKKKVYGILYKAYRL